MPITPSSIQKKAFKRVQEKLAAGEYTLEEVNLSDALFIEFLNCTREIEE